MNNLGGLFFGSKRTKAKNPIGFSKKSAQTAAITTTAGTREARGYLARP
jgi:hypothetical protein